MLQLGTQEVSALYLGETKISRAYLGEKLVFEGSKPSRLPEGYTEVEYIESNGTQYIDTGVKPSTSLVFYIDFYIGSLPSATNCFFGSFYRPESFNVQYRMLVTNEGILRVAYNYDFFDFKNKMTIGRHTSTLIAYTEKAEFDDETISIKPYKTPSFSFNGDIALFASNSRGTIEQYASIRLYSCQVKDQPYDIRDFVPCIDPSGAVGLYDLIDGKFYGNSGTGTFTAGPPV